MTHDLFGGFALLSLALKKLLKLPRVRFFRLRYVGSCLAFFVLPALNATNQTFAMSSEGISKQEYQAAQIDILVAKLLDQGVAQEDVLAILDDATLTNHDVINLFMVLIGEGDFLQAHECLNGQRSVQWCITPPGGYYCTSYCKEIESKPTPSIPDSTPEPPSLPSPSSPSSPPDSTPEPSPSHKDKKDKKDKKTPSGYDPMMIAVSSSIPESQLSNKVPRKPVTAYA